MKNRLLSFLLYASAVSISIFFLFVVIAGTWIGYEVKHLCQTAMNQYGKSCSAALGQQLQDKNQNFRARNEAVWALGQLGDKKSLSTLRIFYTGNIPKREPLDKSLSQYELKKAIRLLESGTNITAFLWR